MNSRRSKHSTVDEVLEKMSGTSRESDVVQGEKGNIRILRKGHDIKEKRPTEMYLNETELKKEAFDKVLSQLKNCKILKTDNGALRVKGGVKAKSRNPGMSDQHLCLRGFFIALEGKMPGEDLKRDQVTYKNEVLAAMGKHITYHSVFELETEMLKLKLISRRIFK